jgi:hypothetical protein
LKIGNTTEDDDFIEVHIWGPMTILSCRKVRYAPNTKQRLSRRVITDALKEKMHRYGVELQV